MSARMKVFDHDSNSACQYKHKARSIFWLPAEGKEIWKQVSKFNSIFLHHVSAAPATPNKTSSKQKKVAA